MKYGYARVSTNDQDLTIQCEALTLAGCVMVRSEKRSGTTTQGRDELENLLSFMRSGDVLVVTRIDRLARSVMDLQTIVTRLKQAGIALICTEQPVDMTTSAGKAFLDMLGVFGEFETNLRRERQLEGIAAAKARGVYQNNGKKRSVSRDDVARMTADGAGPTAIAQALGVSRRSVYNVLEELKTT